jgi:hypothetical protein
MEEHDLKNHFKAEWKDAGNDYHQPNIEES